MTHAGTGACALAVFVLAACAAPQTSTRTTEAQSQEQPRCERIYRVGSSLPVVQCQPSVSEAERQRMIDDWSHAAMPSHGQKATRSGG